MKSTIIKCLVGATVILLSGCLQEPLPIKQWNDSMSAADGTCTNPFQFHTDKGYEESRLWSLFGFEKDTGLCSTKVEPEVKMYKYPLSTDNRMREVISAAALKCYWYVAIQGPGELTLTYWGNDSKQVIYAVHYDKTGYTLTYEDSASMHYNEETGDIHPIYDLWFHGGETYGLYGLKPTLESFVRKAHDEENARGEALFGELKKPKKADQKEKVSSAEKTEEKPAGSK